MIESADVVTYFWYAMGFFLSGFVPALWITKTTQGLEKIT